MKITRPIVFFDLETTGVDVTKDRIVEIAMIKVYPLMGKKDFSSRINPEMPIPEGASEVHGIYDDDVKDEKTFRNIAKFVLHFIEGCDIAGFNSNNFDVPLLKNELARCGFEWHLAQHNFIDVGTMYKRLKPRTLIAAAKDYLGTNLEDAHAATADTEATFRVFEEMMLVHDELPDTVEEIDLYCTFDKPRVDFEGKFTTDDEGYIILNFGKDKNKRVKEAMGFIGWMLKADFSDEVKDICQKIKAGVETLEQLKASFRG